VPTLAALTSLYKTNAKVAGQEKRKVAQIENPAVSIYVHLPYPRFEANRKLYRTPCVSFSSWKHTDKWKGE